MGNLCCRKAVYSPTVTCTSAKMKKAPLPPCLPSQQINGTIQNCEQMASPHPGDDCAINELLEGTMDLEVVLPDARRVRMTIERRMPMMDLLVQVTTANKISPGGHVITLSPEGDRDNLHYKPSTPIGSLDTNTVYIMSKSAINDPPAKKMSRTQLQPFEPTFRLQVNLPRNQLMVMRVSPKTTLAEIKKMVCMEKGFDSTRYHLVHPTQPNYLVDLNCKLSDYGGTEISLMSDLSVSASIRNSTSDLIGYPGCEDEKKRKKLLGIFKRKSKSVNNMMIAGEAFRDTSSSRGVSPARSDICDTRSLRAKRQSTKKRAPPPPPVEQPSSNENSSSSEIPVVITSTTTATTVTTTMVSHSRQSSDSSGYHEASVLSDCPDNLSPETSGGCASSGVGVADSPVQHDISVKRSSRTPTREKPNFSSVASTMLIISTSKKRRAPPPPPLSPNKDSGKTENETDSTPKKDHSPTPVNGEPINSTNSTKFKVTANLSSHQPASPDYLPRSPVISESNESCSPSTSPAGNEISSESSPVYSPVHSPCLPADTAVEEEMPNGNVITNHCHTEEETGEVIHLLEKGADISDNSSILEDELLHEFIPPPLEFATPVPPSEYNGCNEKAPQLIVHTNSNSQDTAKMKSTPTPQPRLTRKISPRQNKACRRSLNFSAISPQKSRHTTDLSVSAQSDIDTSDHPKIESQDATEEINADQLSNKELSDENEISAKILPLNEDEFCTEDEYTAINEVEWDFNIPEPPSPFRNSVDTFQSSVVSENEISSEEIEKAASSKDCDDSFEPKADELLDEKQKTDCLSDEALDAIREKSVSVCSTESSAPPLPSSCPPREENYRAGSVSSDVAPPLPLSEPPPISEPPLPSCSESSLHVTDTEILHSPTRNDNNRSTISANNYASEFLGNEMETQKVDISSHVDNGHETGESTLNQMFVVAPQPRRRAHLQNFTIGSYKNEASAEIITWTSPDNLSDKNITVSDSVDKNRVTTQKHKESDNNKSNISKYDFTIVPFKNRNVPKEDSQWENYTIKDDQVPTRTLTSTHSSVHDLMIEKISSPYSLRKDNSTKIEEERLQEEYKKLQNQLVAWQQQLLKNQTLLQQKQIVPEMNVPIISSINTKSEYAEKETPVYRSQTLPRPKAIAHKELGETIARSSTMEYHSSAKPQVLTNQTLPKPKPIAHKELGETITRSSTMEYHSSAKPQVLTNVTIGSWKSKSTDVFNSNPVTDMKPKFQTLAPIISLPQTNGTVAVNKRRDSNSSLNSEAKARKSPQVSATFDIKHLPRNKEENSDPPIAEKTDGHPALILAQIRNEIKANSRHPAGINVAAADTHFESSRLDSGSAKQSTKVCIKSKPHITYSYFGNPSVNSRSTSQTMVSHTNKHFPENMKNDSNGTKPVVIATIKSQNSWGTTSIGNKDSNISRLHFAQEVPPSLPPPPPPPTLPPATVPIIKSNNKLSDSQIKISRTESSSDPREELMLEIRKFGGKTALRKVPLNQAGWHLKVFGTLSSTPV